MTDKLMGLHQHELVETARVFSGQGQKLEVIFHDGGACMNEGVVKLPATPPDVALSERGQRFDRAMVDHEAGHVAISTMGPLAKYADDNRMMSLINGIEDVRVEKYVTNKYPGSRKNIGTARDISYEGMDEQIMASSDARKFVGANINNAWWEKYGGWPSENRKRAFEALPEALQDFCRRYADLAHNLSSKRGSGPTAKLAEKALKELIDMGPMPPEDQPEGPGGEQEQNKQEQKQEQNSEQGTQERSETDSETNAGQGDGADDDEQDDEGGGQDGEAADDAGDFQEEEDAGDFTEETECEDGDLAKKHEDVRRDESDAETEKYGTHPGDGLTDNMAFEVRADTRKAWAEIWQHEIAERKMWEHYQHYLSPLHWDGDKFDGAWARMMKRVQSKVAPTQARLQEAFMAAAQRNWSGGYDSGALNPKTLVRAYQGREGAFRRKDSGQDLDGAVTLLVDCSGSMGGYKIEVASSMALALALVLERMNISVEVRGFTGGECGYQGTNSDLLFKPFERRVMQCRDGMAALSEANSLGNLDYVHVQSAAVSLLRRDEQRKMLIVLSDGETCGGYGHLRGLCKALHKSPALELLGVGIQSDSVRDYYPNHVVVYNVDELSTVVAGRIAKTLTGRGLVAVKEAA